MLLIPVLMFDGISTAGETLWLDTSNYAHCSLKKEDGFSLTFPFSCLRLERAVSLNELTVWLGDHQFFVVHGDAAISQVLAFFKKTRQHALIKQIKQSSWLSNASRSMRWVLVLVCVFLFGVWAVYRWLLPWGAYELAKQVPTSIALSLDTAVLDAMRGSSELHTSLISNERQQLIRDRVAALGLSTSPSTGQALSKPDQLLFYRVDGMGANAFALPGGHIVVTDELMSAMPDDQVLAVLAHEFGHIELRHGLRGIISQSAIAVFFGLVVGDVSSVLAGAPMLLLAQKYSREFEREADAFAVQALDRKGQDPRLLIQALQTLEKSRQNGSTQTSSSASLLDVLSSHPDVSERAMLIEQALKAKK